MKQQGEILELGLAITALKRGYNLKLVIPDTFSKDKINTLKEYGADVILSDHSKINNSHFILTKKSVILSEIEILKNSKKLNFENIDNSLVLNNIFIKEGEYLLRHKNKEIMRIKI
ncbi:hypothetical protein NRK67_10485 [Fusobacteria bacterium ZRK30]|nr:hypothetical protein NRK67_10485 [Fusobacteria bacterium ZRK30]